MEFENLIKLIETVSASGLTGFQYEEKGIKIKLSKETACQTPIVSAAVSEDLNLQSAALMQVQNTPAVSAAKPQENVKPTEGKVVTSPLVGTFYTAPAEDADPFVAVGDTVKKGQTLAIVEAMKLMNEIESDFDGVIEEVLAENGKPVEYGQPLFRLK